MLLLVAAVVGMAGFIGTKRRLLVHPGLTRDAWRQDIAALADLIRSGHPNPFAHVSRETFDAEVDALRADLPSLTDAQIETRMVRLVALLQDGHSALFPFQPATGFHMLPLQLYLFSDGWYVTAARPTYQRLVGRRVVRIASIGVDEVYRRLRPLIGGDNEATVEDRIPLYALCPEVLEAAGIAPGTQEVVMTLRDSSGGETETAIAPVGAIRYFYWYFAPLAIWKHQPDQSSLPLYRQRTWDNYWMRYLDAQRTLYVAFNQVRDKSDEPFDAFGARVLGFISTHAVDRLVIDLRNNSGGDNTIPRQFVRDLARQPINQPGRLYTIIGRHTFSAAVNFTSDMENRTHTVFVGEATGAGPNHYGDPRLHVLPRSQQFVFISTRYHQWGAAGDTRRAHEPQLRVALSHADYVAGHDPALEAILGQPLPQPIASVR